MITPASIPQPRASLVHFWDFDSQWGADRSRVPPAGPKSWGTLDFEATDRLLELHARFNVPACFAVVGAVALAGKRPYHDAVQIRRVHAAGHEIASHSFRHEWLPGLDRASLLETLRRSRHALEQCIGAPVVSFVPPYNQPFDHARAGSISLAERREAGKTRTTVQRMCQALFETGYKFCRVAYRPLHIRIAEWVSGRRLDRPGRLENIAGITCARLNTPTGFEEPAVEMVNRCAERGGLVVVCGHPHSLWSGTKQDERWLIPFLARVQELQKAGRLRVCRPRELVAEAIH
jgi:hypothetical protein